MNYLKGISTRHHWQGKWIWGVDDGKQENSFYYFRKEFEIEDLDDFLKEDTKLFISADTRYQLYLNGTFLGEGSLQSQPYFMYYDRYQFISEDSLDDNSGAGNHLTWNYRVRLWIQRIIYRLSLLIRIFLEKAKIAWW